MSALRLKSIQLTGYLEFLLSRLGERVQQITPRDPAQRGCHLSLTFKGDTRAVLASLKERGVACDFREPNILRAAPAPLYNTFHDVWKFAQILEGCLR